LIVDEERRRAIAANHSGTHILQAALNLFWENHIKQSGSQVNAKDCGSTSPIFPKSAMRK